MFISGPVYISVYTEKTTNVNQVLSVLRQIGIYFIVYLFNHNHTYYYKMSLDVQSLSFSYSVYFDKLSSKFLFEKHSSGAFLLTHSIMVSAYPRQMKLFSTWNVNEIFPKQMPFGCIKVQIFYLHGVINLINYYTVTHFLKIDKKWILKL